MNANPFTCAIIGKVFMYLEKYPEDGKDRLEAFLEEGKILLDTDEVASMTGWCVAYINQLCRQGDLPYIPGKPHKFMISPLMMALRKLQVGGDYGRQKSRTLNRPKKANIKAKKS